jgi:hypothetical protein
MPESKDHIPYCFPCKCHVSPNVVSEQQQGSSTFKTVKVCPHCGNKVRSKQEIEFDKKFEAENENFEMFIGVGMVLLFVVYWIAKYGL